MRKAFWFFVVPLNLLLAWSAGCWVCGLLDSARTPLSVEDGIRVALWSLLCLTTIAATVLGMTRGAETRRWGITCQWLVSAGLLAGAACFAFQAFTAPPGMCATARMVDVNLAFQTLFAAVLCGGVAELFSDQ